MATQTRYPTSDEATTGTWSTSPYWSKVDEVAPDDTDFITCTALSAGRGRQTFAFSAFSIPTGSTSISVTVRNRDEKASGAAANVGAALKVGGTYYDAAGRNPTTAWADYDDSWANNPKSGLAWTVDDVNGIGANALQALGVTTSDTTPNVSCSQCNITVTYTPPTQNISAAGAIASGEAFGNAKLNLSIASAGAIASAEAFGNAKLNLALSGAGAIASGEAVGNPTVSLAGGAQSITNAGAIASAEAFGSSKLNLALSSAGAVASAEAFGNAKLNLAISGAGAIASGEAFGNPTVSLAGGPQSITNAGAIASAETFGNAHLNLQLKPGGIASAEAFGNAHLTINIKLSAIPSGEAFGLPVVTTGALILQPVGITTLEAFGTAHVVMLQFINVSGIASAESFGALSLAPVTVINWFMDMDSVLDIDSSLKRQLGFANTITFQEQLDVEV